MSISKNVNTDCNCLNTDFCVKQSITFHQVAKISGRPNGHGGMINRKERYWYFCARQDLDHLSYTSLSHLKIRCQVSEIVFCQILYNLVICLRKFSSPKSIMKGNIIYLLFDLTVCQILCNHIICHRIFSKPKTTMKAYYIYPLFMFVHISAV